MSTSPRHDPLETNRRFVRTTAIGLGLWLLLTLTAVGLLFVTGDFLTSLFV